MDEPVSNRVCQACFVVKEHACHANQKRSAAADTAAQPRFAAELLEPCFLGRLCPREATHPIVFVDTLRLKVRAVVPDGSRDISGVCKFA